VLPLLPSEAIELFTPMGERRWVPDWEPTFPAGPSDDDTDPGTVSTDDLTALSARGQQVIERFAEDFGSFLDGWRRSIEAALGA
jgi:hypothetical protein